MRTQRFSQPEDVAAFAVISRCVTSHILTRTFNRDDYEIHLFTVVKA